jgi:hypothetical protein
MIEITDTLGAFRKQQKPHRIFCERARLIYQIDKFLDSSLINLTRHGMELESPMPASMREPIPSVPIWDVQGRHLMQPKRGHGLAGF